MLRRASFVVPVLRLALLAVVPACSEKAPLPAQLGDCDSGKLCGAGTTGGQGTGTGGTPGDSGASCGTISSRVPSCDTCIKGMCCDRNAACTANADCFELVRCVGGCAGDQTCVLACRDRSQNGIADYDNFQDCIHPGCDLSCAGADAGAACGLLVFQTSACTACMDANCCSQNTTCSNNPDCFALSQCAAGCAANSQCVIDCQTQHPNGSSDYTSLFQCGQLNCANQCQ
jgi:hypothetical protein